MSIRIEILENNTVELFTEGQEPPFIRQPQWPNGAAWASADEARSWAEMYVEAMEVPEAPYAPTEPGGERRAKPTAEEIAAFEAEMEARRNPVAPE
jgi:hypothetical protein